MKITKTAIGLVSAIVISVGILGAGFCIGKGFYSSKMFNRYVTVKGLSERDAKADLGIWEISYREVGSDLTDLNKKIQQYQMQVTTFLKKNGFSDQEIETQPLKVEDRLASIYNQPPSATTDTLASRYVVTSGVRIRSVHVALIQKVAQMTGVLLQQGIPVSFESAIVNPNPSYYLTKLDVIRPQMLAEATRSARLLAEQFAKDSGTSLKGIQHASQGIFQIMNRDTSTMNADWNSNQSALGSIDKKVRLVTTIDYRLR